MNTTARLLQHARAACMCSRHPCFLTSLAASLHLLLRRATASSGLLHAVKRGAGREGGRATGAVNNRGSLPAPALRSAGACCPAELTLCEQGTRPAAGPGRPAGGSRNAPFPLSSFAREVVGREECAKVKIGPTERCQVWECDKRRHPPRCPPTFLPSHVERSACRCDAVSLWRLHSSFQ